jgi:hypothetical protein
MAIPITDIKIHYSGTSLKNGPGGPQGGVISTNTVPEQTLDGGITVNQTMFFDVTDLEARNGMKRYFGGYIKNNHGSLTAQNIKIWQNALTPGADSIRIGYSGAAPNTHDPLNSTTNTEVYNVERTESFSSLNDDRERAGFYVSSTGAPIYDKAIILAEIYLLRVGSPTGTLAVKQKNRLSETVQVDFGTKDVTTIDNVNPTLYQFSNPTNTYKTKVEDIISIEYTNGNASNYIQVFRKANNPVANMHVINYDGEQWRNVSDFDLSGKLHIAGTGGDKIAPAGVTFENPTSRDTAIALPNLTFGSFVPFWLRQDVPANASEFDKNTFELTIEYDSTT